MARAQRSSRGSRNFRVVFTLLVCGALFTLVACKKRSAGVELDTQPSALPKPDMVARVLSSDILVADLTGTTAAERCRQLAVKLTGPLFEAYGRENDITADESEIAECQAAFARPAAKAPFSADLARNMITQYKIDRQLYHAYGGEVIFQQANPFQPVGAYREFLKEQERLGRFEIVDNDYRECFWQQFSTANASVVPESEIDFSQPWWKRMNTP